LRRTAVWRACVLKDGPILQILKFDLTGDADGLCKSRVVCHQLYQ